MQRIETRTQLINFICENIAQRAIVRACHNGEVQVLGGFSKIPLTRRPGWIVSITSVYGRTWLVAIIPDDHQHVFRTGIVDSIPWQYYVGRIDRDEYSIYDGDRPEQAERAKNAVH